LINTRSNFFEKSTSNEFVVQAAVDAQLRFAAEEEEVARKGKSVRQEAPVLAQRRVVSAPAPVAPAPAQADYADYY
jgi:hypothetical protein